MGGEGGRKRGRENIIYTRTIRILFFGSFLRQLTNVIEKRRNGDTRETRDIPVISLLTCFNFSCVSLNNPVRVKRNEETEEGSREVQNGEQRAIEKDLRRRSEEEQERRGCLIYRG